MSQSNWYDVCCKYHGKRVRITCRDGSVHTGVITKTSRDMVWIRPVGTLGGYGYGFGFGGFRLGFGIALGAITGIALASAFFW